MRGRAQTAPGTLDRAPNCCQTISPQCSQCRQDCHYRRHGYTRLTGIHPSARSHALFCHVTCLGWRVHRIAGYTDSYGGHFRIQGINPKIKTVKLLMCK